MSELAAELVRQHHALDAARFMLVEPISEGYRRFLRGSFAGRARSSWSPKTTRTTPPLPRVPAASSATPTRRSSRATGTISSTRPGSSTTCSSIPRRAGAASAGALSRRARRAGGARRPARRPHVRLAKPRRARVLRGAGLPPHDARDDGGAAARAQAADARGAPANAARGRESSAILRAYFDSGTECSGTGETRFWAVLAALGLASIALECGGPEAFRSRAASGRPGRRRTGPPEPRARAPRADPS